MPPAIPTWKARITAGALRAGICLSAFAVSACEEPNSVKVEYRYRNLHEEYLSRGPDILPVVVQGSPGAIFDSYISRALAAAAVKQKFERLKFPVSDPRPLSELTVEVAFGPDRERTGISLCQHKEIGGKERSSRSVTLIVALCKDGRRLSSVRGARSLPGNPEDDASALTGLIDEMTAVLFKP